MGAISAGKNKVSADSRKKSKAAKSYLGEKL